MAESEKKNPVPAEEASESLIDPIYERFSKSVVRALGSTDFYEYFMDALSKAENVIQFSNRRLEKTVDPTWVDMIESCLKPLEKVVNNPRNVIKEETLIVNVANAKKFGADVVRHVAQHASFVENYDEVTGDVRPSKVQQKFREESAEQYDNRVVYTVLDNAYQFVKIRHDALFNAMNDEMGAKLQVNTDMSTSTEVVEMDFFMHIKDIDSALETDEKNAEIFARISRIYRLLGSLRASKFAEQLAKLGHVKGALVKTNVLKRNPDYRAIAKVYDFLRSYDDVGYSIKVIEQNPQVSETFQRDIFHNVLFNYIVLKGYLEDEKDRRLPAPKKEKRRKLKPKFIREIIEELTEDYDLPDVEIRRVLIEELTKEQLMQEEEAERLRLVEEQAKRKAEEEERKRLEAEAEAERKRKEKEAEEERKRLAAEAEAERIRQEKLEQLAEDRRRSSLFKKELLDFESHLEDRLAQRQEALTKKEEEKLDFADAAMILEDMEQRKREEIARERRRRREEADRARREQQLAEEQARREEELRQEAIRKEQEAERLRLLQIQLEQERQEREAQRQRDLALAHNYIAELDYFRDTLPDGLRQRAQEDARWARLAQSHAQAKQNRERNRTS